MERATIPVTIIMLTGILMIIAGMMYYVFIGPHPDASGSIQENVLNPLFWTDHPGIASIALGLILWIVGHILDSRTRRSSQLQKKREPMQEKPASADKSKSK
jgi:heme/copper-type cytochrome/quinol oxidase subunit 2